MNEYEHLFDDIDNLGDVDVELMLPCGNLQRNVYRSGKKVGTYKDREGRGHLNVTVTVKSIRTSCCGYLWALSMDLFLYTSGKKVWVIADGTRNKVFVYDGPWGRESTLTKTVEIDDIANAIVDQYNYTEIYMVCLRLSYYADALDVDVLAFNSDSVTDMFMWNDVFTSYVKENRKNRSSSLYVCDGAEL